jgi:hypothetical protein
MPGAQLHLSSGKGRFRDNLRTQSLYALMSLFLTWPPEKKLSPVSSATRIYHLFPSICYFDFDDFIIHVLFLINPKSSMAETKCNLGVEKLLPDHLKVFGADTHGTLKHAVVFPLMCQF